MSGINRCFFNYVDRVEESRIGRVQVWDSFKVIHSCIPFHGRIYENVLRRCAIQRLAAGVQYRFKPNKHINVSLETKEAICGRDESSRKGQNRQISINKLSAITTGTFHDRFIFEKYPNIVRTIAEVNNRQRCLVYQYRLLDSQGSRGDSPGVTLHTGSPLTVHREDGLTTSPGYPITP